MDCDHGGRNGDHPDGNEVAIGVRHVVPDHAVRDHARAADQPRVTVGLRLRDVLGADDRARPRLVLDDDRLTETLGNGLGSGARDKVVRAARTEGDHH